MFRSADSMRQSLRTLLQFMKGRFSNNWARRRGQSGRRRRACALASVRRPNCTCGFPACSFHQDTWPEISGQGNSPGRLFVQSAHV